MKTLMTSSRLIHFAGFVLLGSFLLGGCATTNKPAAKIDYPSKARGWNGVDEVEFAQPFKLADYSRLVVAAVETNKCTLPPKEENTHAPAVAVLGQVDAIVYAEVARGLTNKLQVVAQKVDAVGETNALLLKIKVAEFNPGSVAARFWVGFGAGSGWVRMDGELVDMKTQKTLLKFDQRRISSMRLDYQGMLAACTREIAGDVARLITMAENK